MALLCPNVNDAKWKQLVSVVGESAAYRTFYRFAHLADPLQATLDKFNISNYTIEQKIGDLSATSDKITKVESVDPDTGEPIHEYRTIAGKVLDSVSRILDRNDDTKYRGGESVGSQYSDKGTAVHRVFEMYIKDFSQENVMAYMREQKIPESFYNQVSTIINHLKTRGKVLSETMLADLDVGAAGTGDIPVLLYDGTIELYDIKTAHLTAGGAARGITKIWDPVGHFNGYKARRYPTQLEFYSRMIERTTGQPVSKKYILPIEIRYLNNNPLDGFDTIKPLPYEDVDTYGNSQLADKIVSDYFGDNKPTANLPALSTIDDSDELLSTITGRIEGREADLDADAERVLSRPENYRIIRGEKYFVNRAKNNELVRLRDQSNRAMQRRQVIDEYLSKINTGRENIVESFRNYLTTGNDVFLNTEISSAKNIRAMLDIYKGRRDISVSKLSDIKGFEKKKNWILITDGNTDAGGTYDLIYVGNDVLDETLNVGRKSRKGDTLFAKFNMTASDASHLLGSNLKNRVGDARHFEAGLIALKLRESAPNTSFKRILVSSTNSLSQPVEAVDLYRILPIIQKFGKIKPNLIPTNLKSVFNNEALFDGQQYAQNAIQAYKTFTMTYLNARPHRGVTDEMIAAYEKDKTNYESLMYKALADAKSIQAAGLTTDPILKEEVRLLNNIYYNLEKIGQEIYPIGFKGQLISMPQNIGSSIIQDLVVKTSDTLRRITGRFWNDYKKVTESAFNKLFAPFYTPGGIRDAILSDTDRYYEPLFEKETKNIITGQDEAGNSIIEQRAVNTYSLVDEKSDAFRALSEPQQDFIKMFNDRVQEAMLELGIEWKRGRIPLVHSSYRNQLYKSTQLGADATLDHYKNSLRKMFDEMENAFVDTVRGNDEFSLRNRNIFYAQLNNNDVDGRLTMMGFSKDGFVDMDKHFRWETNLEIVLDLTMMTAYRTDEMDRLNNIFGAAKTHFDWQKSNLFDERLGANVDFVNTYRTAIIDNKDVDSGTIQSKLVRTALKTTSALQLGFKPGVALLATIGAQFTALSQAVSNTFAGTSNFGIGDWTKAGFMVSNPGNYKKVSALLEQYQLYQLDMTSQVNGYHRYGNKSVFKMKWMYGMMNAGDWLSRSQILVAQLLKDNVWDAYSIDENGKLQYDTNKDGRDPLLKTTIKANLEKDGITEPRAYDFNLTKSLKGQIDMVIGGFDRETRGMYSFKAYTKLLGQFKTYMPSRIDKLTAAPFQSKIIGKYELTEDEDGKKQYLWKGDQLEGMFHSLNMGMYYLKNLNSENNVELTPNQKENLYRFAGDMAMIGLFTLLGYAIKDPDDDNKLDDFTAYSLQGAVRDLLAFYNVVNYLDFISTPIALAFIQKSSKRVYNIAMNAADPESDTLSDSIDLLPAAKEYKQIADYLYDQPSE